MVLKGCLGGRVLCVRCVQGVCEVCLQVFKSVEECAELSKVVLACVRLFVNVAEMVCFECLFRLQSVVNLFQVVKGGGECSRTPKGCPRGVQGVSKECLKGCSNVEKGCL